MKDLISIEEMFDNLKTKSNGYRLSIEAADKTVEIINKIIKTRERMGISQRELAQRCGMKQPALARIEAFKVIPKVNTLIKIANAVGISIDIVPIEEKTTIRVLLDSEVALNRLVYDSNGGYKWDCSAVSM